MTHLKAVKPKSGLPIHEEPQHSYTLPSHLYLDESIYEQEKQKSFTVTGTTLVTSPNCLKAATT